MKNSQSALRENTEQQCTLVTLYLGFVVLNLLLRNATTEQLAEFIAGAKVPSGVPA
jgi:hypothetical protein